MELSRALKAGNFELDIILLYGTFQAPRRWRHHVATGDINTLQNCGESQTDTEESFWNAGHTEISALATEMDLNYEMWRKHWPFPLMVRRVQQR